MKKNLSLILLALTLVGGAVNSSPLERKSKTDETVETYRQRQIDATPTTVLQWLREGNQRFAEGRSRHGGYVRNARERIQNSSRGQRPLAVILSCIDSRTSPELVFDTSVGDLFTARVGANAVNDDILGSLEIAVESGAKVVVVLGHTNCGGIIGACSGLELGHMTQLLERIKPAIAITNQRLDQDPILNAIVGKRVVSNRRYIAEIGRDNAAMSARQILERSPILRTKVISGEIILLPALYSVDSGYVGFGSVSPP